MSLAQHQALNSTTAFKQRNLRRDLAEYYVGTRRAAQGQKSPPNPCSGSLRQLTESQNHRIVGVRRDLCGSSSPTPLLKQGHLQQAAQDLVQAGLEYLQRRRLHSLPGQPGPGLRHQLRFIIIILFISMWEKSVRRSPVVCSATAQQARRKTILPSETQVGARCFADVKRPRGFRLGLGEPARLRWGGWTSAAPWRGQGRFALACWSDSTETDIFDSCFARIDPKFGVARCSISSFVQQPGQPPTELQLHVPASSALHLFHDLTGGSSSSALPCSAQFSPLRPSCLLKRFPSIKPITTGPLGTTVTHTRCRTSQPAHRS